MVGAVLGAVSCCCAARCVQQALRLGLGSLARIPQLAHSPTMPPPACRSASRALMRRRAWAASIVRTQRTAARTAGRSCWPGWVTARCAARQPTNTRQPWPLPLPRTRTSQALRRPRPQARSTATRRPSSRRRRRAAAARACQRRRSSGADASTAGKSGAPCVGSIWQGSRVAERQGCLLLLAGRRAVAQVAQVAQSCSARCVCLLTLPPCRPGLAPLPTSPHPTPPHPLLLLRCRVWWRGDSCFYPARISSYKQGCACVCLCACHVSAMCLPAAGAVPLLGCSAALPRASAAGSGMQVRWTCSRVPASNPSSSSALRPCHCHAPRLQLPPRGVRLRWPRRQAGPADGAGAAAAARGRALAGIRPGG